MPSAPEYDYWLRDQAGDLSVPACSDASWLLLRLANKGVLVAVDEVGIIATPKSKLSDDDKQQIRTLKAQLAQMLLYQPPEVM